MAVSTSLFPVPLTYEQMRNTQDLEANKSDLRDDSKKDKEIVEEIRKDKRKGKLEEEHPLLISQRSSAPKTPIVGIDTT